MKAPRKTVRWTLSAAVLLAASSAIAGINVWTTNGPPSSFISALALDPLQSGTLYAGTGDGNVFETRDGGASWNALAPANLDSKTVWALAIDPSDPSLLYAGLSRPSPAGVVKSTDGGAHWSMAGLQDWGVVSLTASSAPVPTIYAGTAGSLGGARATGIQRSADGGLSWNLMTNLARNISALLSDPRYPSRLYASGDVGDFDYPEPGLIRSMDGGHTWSVARTCGRFRSLTLDPTNPSTLYAGDDGCHRVLKSTDMGNTWTEMSQGLPPSSPVSAIVLDPLQPQTLYAGAGDAGVFRSTDGAGSWTPFNPGLTDLQVSRLVIDSTGTSLHAGTATGHVFDIQIAPSTSPCVPGPDRLCLLGARFAVTLAAEDPRTGSIGIGRAIPQSDRFGYFSLPVFTGDPTFPEVFIKMADATAVPPPLGGYFWVFHTGLTDLQYTMTVTDTVTGAVQRYQNDRSDPARLCGGADTAAFR